MSTPGSARALYHRLLIDGCGPGELTSLPEAPEGSPCESLEGFWAGLSVLRDDEERRATDVESGADAAKILLAYAPTAMLDGCWLEASVRVRRSDSELGAACLDALYLECGEGDAAHHHGNLYRAALAAQGLALPDPASFAFASDPRLRDEDFELALAGLRLGRFGEDQVPEALGFHAAATVLGAPAAVRRASGDACSGAYFAEHTPDAPLAQRAVSLARRCLEAYADHRAADFARVWRGAWSLAHSRRAWSASLRPAARPSAWEAMLSLLESKAPHAFGFHRGVTLDGQAADHWFDPARFDARELLGRLARSPWVVPGAPSQSRLVLHSVAFGGPMFGVFSEAEIGVIRDWIRALAHEPEPPALLASWLPHR